MVSIVPELAAHIPAREALLDSAFGTHRRAKTSERLREGRLPADGLALAALEGGRIVGTVRLWNVSAGPGRPALLLGPLAVEAGRRSEGIGGGLMRQSIDRAVILGHRAVLLVGDAPYYVRFGFSAAPTRRLWLPGPHERGRFLGLELVEGALEGAAGLVNPTGGLASIEEAWPVAA
jgi:predicted N-acetyltransferase YhbS